MTEKQIALLWSAAQHPGIERAQLYSLQAKNPYLCKGQVAAIIQSEVTRLDPDQASKWKAEANSSDRNLVLAARRIGLH